MELNLKSLDELKEKVLAHKVDWSKYSAKEQRKIKEQYTNDTKTLVHKVDLINEYTERLRKYESDVGELLVRLKKHGFIFLEEKVEEKPETKLGGFGTEEAPEKVEEKPEGGAPGLI